MVDSRSHPLPGAGRPAWRQAGDMTNDTAVRVSGLRKRYGDTCAVDGVELEISRGEVFALLGPNGAGKTTTVEILEGFRRREGGGAGRARIGIVLQLASAGPELTVREMVRHFAGFYPQPRDPDEVIALVG